MNTILNTILNTIRRSSLVALACLLFALGSVYQLKGTHALVAGATVGDAVDLQNRTQEQHLYHRGLNPYDHMQGTQPPWGYAFGSLLTWPEWPSVRTYFAAVNLLALACLLVWAYRQAAGVGWPGVSGSVLLGAAFAFGGACTATEVGQIGIIVTALLAWSLWHGERRRDVLFGLLLACALIKPTISAPFALALVFSGRVRAVAVLAVYLALTSAVTWLVVGASPLHLVGQMAAAAATYISDGTLGFVDALSAAGLSPLAVSLLSPLIVAVPGLCLMARCRRSLSLLFAIAAVWGRMWTYHKSYDDIMLVFLLVPLGLLAARDGWRGLAMVTFLVVGCLFWLPGRVLSIPVVQIAQAVSWVAGLGYLVVRFKDVTAPLDARARAVAAPSLVAG